MSSRVLEMGEAFTKADHRVVCLAGFEEEVLTVGFGYQLPREMTADLQAWVALVAGSLPLVRVRDWKRVAGLVCESLPRMVLEVSIRSSGRLSTKSSLSLFSRSFLVCRVQDGRDRKIGAEV